MEPACAQGLMATLKQGVGERHARMEALPFVTALAGGTLPLEAYLRQLRAMAVIHGVLEHELAGAAEPELRAARGDRPSRLVHLRRDLSLIDRFEVPDQVASVAAAQALADRIRRCREDRPLDLLAIIYVLEGMTLGNATHLRDVLRSFGARTGGNAHYYAGYGDRTGASWLAFAAAMDALAIDPAGRERLVRVAHQGFDHLEALYRSLHPGGGELAHTASMLNPEAGDHPVPGRAEELRAALAAAAQCRAEFPYFDARFQERGQAFARSDAAWLATLAPLPADQLFDQVEWLARVLANRGMPRITLERQLVLLHDQLAQALPERAGAWAGLLAAAAGLRAERFRLLPEPRWQALERAFRAATGQELSGRMRNTGALIVSAVVDEAAGLGQAVTSLMVWLADPQRFPSTWLEAVGRTEQEARRDLTG